MRRSWIGVALVLMFAATGARAVEGYHFEAAQPPLTIHGANPNDYLGAQISRGDDVGAGDLNGDGIPDLAVGSCQLDGPGGTRPDGGEVDIFFGPLLTGQVWDLALRPPDLRIYGREPLGRFGSSVRIGDVNGDGAADLAVGAPSTNRPDATDSDRGEVCVFFGPLGTGVFDMAVQEPGLCVVGARRPDAIGESVAIGDVSGDGTADLILGGEYGTHGAGVFVGGLYVLFGPIGPGPLRDLRVVPPDATIIGATEYCGLGWRVELGDVSGDGQQDIVAAMRGLVPAPGTAATGGVAAIFGPLSAGVTDLRSAMPDVLISGGGDFDAFGNALSVADLNGDSIAEIVTGAPEADGPGDLWRDAGEVHVQIGPLARGTRIDNIATFSDIVFTREVVNASFGESLSAASLGSTGRILMGAQDDGEGPCYSGGQAYAVTTLPPPGSVVEVTTIPSTLAIGWGSSDDCGTTCVQADLSGDSIPEMLIGGPRYGPDMDRPYAGALFVVGDDDRCEEVPAGFPADGLHVRRSGDDVLLDFDGAGLGPEMLGVDVFRGTIDSLDRWRRYDHAVIAGGCGALTSPFADVGAAAPAVENRYYIVTRGCPAACAWIRYQGSLGSDSLGVARPMPNWPDGLTCQ